MKLIYPISIILLLAASCKEQPIQISTVTAEDSTYTTTPEQAQSKMILIEELTGVECVNCPQGAAKLEELNAQNGNSLVIVSLHAGSLTNPIHKDGFVSTQNFQTDDGIQLLNTVFNGQGNKPSIAVDRLPIGSATNQYFVENYYQNWSPAIDQAKTTDATPPVNVYIASVFNTEKNQYDIEAKVAYNEAMTGKQALHIFLTESNITDVQETANPDTPILGDYIFNHVFRKALTPVSGKIILNDQDSKEAGRVYLYRFALKIDPNDPGQQFWKPENMHVVAFVSAANAPDIHVYQAAETTLK